MIARRRKTIVLCNECHDFSTRETLIQTEEILGWRAGYIERCKSGSEGGTRHTYWVNGPYPTECQVGGRSESFWTAWDRGLPIAASFYRVA